MAPAEKKAPHEKRSRQVKIRMTLAEQIQLDAIAASLGITPAEFMRRRAFGYSLPRQADQQQALLKAVAVLAATGNNLNQLTRYSQRRTPAPCRPAAAGAGRGERGPGQDFHDAGRVR